MKGQEQQIVLSKLHLGGLKMSENIINRRLILRFQTGVDQEGNDILKDTTINHIRPDATDENLQLFASKYGALSAHPHLESIVVNHHLLSQAE